jgi:Zn-dependent peptidase ImmA (M78 family)
MPKSEHIYKITDFYNLVFPKMKLIIERTFFDGSKVDFIEGKPFVDIETIATNLGITDIQRIPPEIVVDGKIIYYIKHAVLIGTTIFLNINDSPEKQRFSIAHEIFEFLFRKDNDDGLKAVARQGEAWKTQNAENNKAIDEILFDYFAANLLVPTERFILFEDKPNEEIALAFGLEPRCIEIRREEIEHELDIMAPKNLSSDVKLEEMTPLSLDELDQVLEGHSINDMGRA